MHMSMQRPSTYRESAMQIQDMVIFIAGAHRGLGWTFARAALELGAKKLSAAARDRAHHLQIGVHAMRLDATRAEFETKLYGPWRRSLVCVWTSWTRT
jgi:NAD(P)-dependent dehydrogenase (short-subunit alcohol dehydrogenase family)